VASQAKKPVRNLTTFRAEYDLAEKIKNTLAKLRKDHGEQAYVYEQTNPADDDAIPPLTKLLDVGINVIAPYRNQFKEFWVEVRLDTGSSRRSPRRVWFASVQAAAAARGGPVDSAEDEE
jgi:hypothetical protein